MKNHFFFPYAGNKRNEVHNILKYIESCNFDNIKTIFEPFCGTSALSYFISTKYPHKFNYILNDSNDKLIEFYKLVQDEETFRRFNLDLNIKVQTIINKDVYLEIKKENTLLSWFIMNKVYSIKPGLYHLNYKPKAYDLMSCPIVHFLRNENIRFENTDGTEILTRYQNDIHSFIFIDPPYLSACNTFYKNHCTNIYEFINHHPINKMNALIILVLEDNWIIKLLFPNNIKETYDKKYEASKKQTSHLLISNAVTT